MIRSIGINIDYDMITDTEINNLIDRYVEKKKIKLDHDQKFIVEIKNIWDKIEGMPIYIKNQVQFQHFAYNEIGCEEEEKTRNISLNTFNDFLEMYKSFGLIGFVWEHRNQDDYMIQHAKHKQCLRSYLDQLKRLIIINDKIDSILNLIKFENANESESDKDSILLELQFGGGYHELSTLWVQFKIKVEINIQNDSENKNKIEIKSRYKYIGTYKQNRGLPYFILNLDGNYKLPILIQLDPLESPPSKYITAKWKTRIFPENYDYRIEELRHWRNDNLSLQDELRNFGYLYKYHDQPQYSAQSFDLECFFPKNLSCIRTIEFKNKNKDENEKKKKSMNLPWICNYQIVNPKKFKHHLIDSFSLTNLKNNVFNHLCEYIIFDYWKPQDENYFC